MALDATTGETVWEYEYPAPWKDDMDTRFGPGPNSTPLIVGDRIYAIGATVKLHCLDKNTGKKIWGHDLVEEYKAESMLYGYGASPAAYKDTIILPLGGEGQGVFLLETPEALDGCLERAERFEKGGQKGFLLQEFVPHRGRTLRVAVIGETLFSYWRVQTDKAEFLTNLRSGAVVDHEADPNGQEVGKAVAEAFCAKTGINLAGLDLLFPDAPDKQDAQRESLPLFLEINYYFGRRGLGGSLHYYELVDKAVAQWVKSLGLSLSGAGSF